MKSLHLPIVVALLLTTTGLHATEPATPGQSTTPPVTAFVPPISASQIQARISTLSAQKEFLADDQSLLIRELDQVDAEIGKVSDADGNLHDFGQDKATADKNVQLFQTAMQSISGLNCTTGADSLDGLVSAVSSPLTSVTALTYSDGLGTMPFAQPLMELQQNLFAGFAAGPNALPRSGPQDRCKAIQALWNDGKRKQQILDYFNQIDEKLNAAAQYYATYHANAQTLLQKLKEREAAIQAKAVKVNAKKSISDDLWIIMAVIGTFSVLIFVGVTRFTPELQMEWVASGQVIQFVTVMTLLSVIMALGLAGILQGETLGTLLGGIAGYVLAQGVGRAAARDAERRAANQGPSPPGTPSSPTDINNTTKKNGGDG